jgi:hypothetical protein
MKKKIILLSVLSAFALSFISCKKDYTCHCNKTSNAGEDHYVIRDRKKKAREACEAIKAANPSVYSGCVIE